MDIRAQVAALSLNPGDYVVIRSSVRLTAESAAKIKESLYGIIADHPIMVLQPELSLEVARNGSMIPEPIFVEQGAVTDENR